MASDRGALGDDEEMRRRLRGIVVAALAACLARGAAAQAQGPAAGTLAFREPAFHFFSGEQAARTVIFTPAADGERPSKTRLHWRVTVGNAVMQQGSVGFEAGGDGPAHAIILTMPEVRRIVRGVIGLSLQQDAKVLATGGHDVALFPPVPAVPALLKDKKIVLYDPTGRTAAALGYLGVKYSELPQTWSLATGEADLLVIGSGVPDDRLARLLEQVKGNVAEGMAVVCLEQVRLDESRLPYLGLEDATAGLATWVETLGKRPLRGELADEVLSAWREDGEVVRRPFAGPTRGNFRILLDVAESAAGPQHAAAVEVPLGKGKLVFSQMLIGEKSLQEPVARYALVNLLVHAAEPAQGLGARAAVLAGADEPQFFRALKLIGLESGPGVPPVADCGALLISGSAEGAERLKAASRQECEDVLGVLKRDGTVLLLGAEPEALGAFEFLWDGTLTVGRKKEGKGFDFASISGYGVCQGLRPGELSRLCERARYPSISFVGRGPKAQAVSGDGLIVLPGEQGKVIVWQLPLPQDEKDEEALRTYSQLLTGLEVELKIPERRDQ